ncbi:uncharacterized protein LOC135963298 [Calliphora vicina]|uniref:uncharacterized protein LOC135963298 n=1 Tax=Calliphora vicina TaxID=7373 RepID=UPI00325BAD04
MFQDTLLIIKPDYLAKRKPLLLHLLQEGFFIKAQRKILFTPELAAEFYQDLAEDRCFMFQVILLSKGNSEAFILAKECAVEVLINDMVCYFGTSIEMEQNIHVTKCLTKVQREISFIFPNYIHEPIYCPEQIKFCTNNSLVQSTITTLYDIVKNREKDPHKSWKEKLAESLILANKTLPHISNQCCHSSNLNAQDMAQQTKITCFKHVKEDDGNYLSSDMDISKYCSSLNFTTSSCVSCSGFDSGAECIKQTYERPLSEVIKARTAPLTAQESSSISTVETVQENVLEELVMDEHVAVVDVADFGEDQVLYDNEKEENVKSDLADGEGLDNDIITDFNMEIKADVILTTEPANINDNAINEIPDIESPQLSTNDNKVSIEDIAVTMEESAHPAAEDNKQSVEEIVQSPEENELASAIENKKSSVEISAPLDKNVLPVIGDALHSSV